ncbi:MAG: NAD-dependent epimerase/dehydratase family protein [Gemmatimonadota bacterium]
MTRVLVTGAAGQIGTELVPALRAVHGDEAVLATDLRSVDEDHALRQGGPFQTLDCTSGTAVAETVRGHGARVIYHLAALLSAVGERKPQEAYRVNLGGLMAVLEVAREQGLAVFTPSSIAAFGPSTPPDPAPQDTLQRPSTMYGVTKVASELLCDYYHHRFQVDTRGLRYPGLVSHSAPPGGGTTDWAVEIYHHALERGSYTSFLRDDTRLDMMYMEDAIRCAMELMEADPEQLQHRNAFNVTAMQITPGELATEIRRILPHFRLSVEVDPVRQAIADSWPRRIDDTAAREEWGWVPRFDAARMTRDMFHHLRARGGPSPLT